MKFEIKFRNDIDNYTLVFLDKIKKITHFDIIFKLIEINNIEDKQKKDTYLSNLNRKYDYIIGTDALLDTKEQIIQHLCNLTFYMCQNEGKIDFLKAKINQQVIINKKLRHKIYISLIKKCNEQNKNETNNNKEIKEESDNNTEKKENFKVEIISHIKNQYLKSLEFNNVNEFIELLIQLEEDELNDYLEKLGDKFIIGNTEFYSEKEEISIRLFNLIIQKLKPKLKEVINI